MIKRPYIFRLLTVMVFMVSVPALAQGTLSVETVKQPLSPYESYIRYDQVKGLSPELEAQLVHWQEKEIRHFKKETDKERERTLDLILENSYQQGQVVSVRYKVIAFEGGAHPTTTNESFVFDVSSKDRLAVSDLFEDPEKGLVWLRAQSCQTLGIERERLPLDFDRFADFAFTSEGLVVHFALYSLGDRSGGEPQVMIPYADLAPYLKKTIRKILKK